MVSARRNHRVPADDDALLHQLPGSLRDLARRGAIRHYKRATRVLSEGEAGDSLYVVLAGSVKAFSTDGAGREIHYNTIRAGEYFGEMSLDGGLRSASVTTLEACVFAVLSRDAVVMHLAAQPAFAMDLVTQVISRARKATETARSMALLDVYGRVLHVLESMCPPGSGLDEPVVIRPVTHLGIAARVGSSREMVSRIMKELERDGYLSLGFKCVTLLRKLPTR